MAIIKPRSVDRILSVFTKTITDLEDRQSYLDNQNAGHVVEMGNLQTKVAANTAEVEYATAVLGKLRAIVQ